MKIFLPSVLALWPGFPSKRGGHLLAVVSAGSALVLVCIATGVAQDFKIGFVGLEKFAIKSVKAQALQKKLTDLLNAARTQSPLGRKKQELAALQEKLQKLSPMLREETRYQWTEEIGIKEEEINKLAEKESWTRASSEVPDAGKILHRDLVKIIARIQRQKGLVIVFDKTAVLSADYALDITDEVAEAYDAEPDLKARAPATAPKPKAPAAAPISPDAVATWTETPLPLPRGLWLV